MTNILRATVTALCLAFLASPAQAVLVTIEPDDFADGTDISHAFAGVTLSTVTGGSSGAVFSRTDAAATTGARTFANLATDGQVDNLVWFEAGFVSGSAGPVLRVDFDTLTNFVALDFASQDSFDGAVLRLFDAADQLIAEISSSVGGASPNGTPITLMYTAPSLSIAYVTASGPSAQDPAHLDNLRFNLEVAEPASALLLLSGLTAFGLSRRRRR